MIRQRFTRGPLVVLSLLAAAACGGEEQGATPDAAGDARPEAGAGEAAEGMSERRVVIARPEAGDTVEGPTVTVELDAHGFQVVPAGDTTPNSGHHHLFLDRDVSPADEPIPAEEGHIVHMGDGSTTFTFEGVEPGDHRLIAVVGDAIHVPVSPPLQDTVEFTVR